MKKITGRIISCVLAFALIVGLFVGIGVTPSAYAEKDICGYSPTATISALSNSGNSADQGSVYSISTADELLAFASYVNSGKNTKDVTFYLKADIDLSGVEYTPAGTSSKPFYGTFDGCGFAVLNLNIDSSDSNVGLFAYVGGTVINLGVVGSVTGANNVSGIAANLFSGKIENCWANVTVNAASNAGGIVGNLSAGTIVNCCNYGDINASSSCGAICGSVSGNYSISYSYYIYQSAGYAYSKVVNSPANNIYRFSSNSESALTEKVITIDKTSTDDLTELLNAWIDVQENDDNYRSWVFDNSETGLARTGGRYPYPSHKYPGYIMAIDELYTATSSVSALYTLQQDAVSGGYYSISSASELKDFSNYVNEGYNTSGATFYLTQDIAVSTGLTIDTISEELSWTPIGNEDYPFEGVFDGQGYIINGVLMVQHTDDLGLFGYVDNGSSIIKNVGVSSIINNGDDNVGGIAGNLINGSIINCWYDGSIQAADRVGGIVGNCDNGKILNCACFAPVVGDKNVGAIVGDTTSSTAVKYCYYSQNSDAGYGSDKGTFSVVISFIGSDTDFDLERSINVNGYTTSKLLNALNQWVRTLAPDSTYRAWKIDDSAESIARVHSIHPILMFPGDNSGIKYVEEPYEETEQDSNPYDVYYASSVTMTELYNSSTDANAMNNYSISSGEEMLMLAEYVNNGYLTEGITFYLTDDISIAEQCLGNNGDGWIPIGRDTSLVDESTYFRSFNGIFDGCGYTVSNFYLSKNEADDAGLFGNIDGATIKNLGVSGDMIAENKCGGIAGDADDSQIINCWTAVNIQAEDRVGGIAGKINDTDIINCVSYGSMLAYGGSSGAVAGGIFGVSNGTCEIKHCYYLADVTSSGYEDASSHTTIDITGFNYKFVGDEYSCVLESAGVVDDVSSTDLLTTLNAWVYADNSGMYCSWFNSSSLIEVNGASGHFPRLMPPNVDETGYNDEYKGDYEQTATMSQLYSYKKDGAEGACYSINDLADLEALQKYVADGFKTKDIIFFMTRDIDMSGKYNASTEISWNPIGDADEPFQGIFDGQGYTIKYLYINTTKEDQGLFGHMNMGATVKNLGVTGVVLAAKNCAGICGDFNFSTIANCWVCCQVTATDNNAGGIVGIANGGTIVNCTNYGAVVEGAAYGAIAAFAAGTDIQYCYYLYATCQRAYCQGSIEAGTDITIGTGTDDWVVTNGTVSYFNGTSAACILKKEVNVEGTTTRNALSALKLYVDAHPEVNYCYWTTGNTEEYLKMGVADFPVLISASGTMGEKIFSEIVAYYNDVAYYDLSSAVTAANDNPNGGDITLATNVILNMHKNLTLDDNVRIKTGDYSLVIKSDIKLYSMQQLNGMFILKEEGSIYLYDSKSKTYKFFMYSAKDADATCDAEIFGTESLTFFSYSGDSADAETYYLSLHDGVFNVNSTLNSGNPHTIPPLSNLTIEKGATLNVMNNARIRTTGEAEIWNYGTVKIGDVTLDMNGGAKLKGVLEDDNGTVTLPYAFKDANSKWVFSGWTNNANSKHVDPGVDYTTDGACTLSAAWQYSTKPADADDEYPYPGDNYYDDADGSVKNIPITVISSNGGTISPQSTMAAKGENMTITVTPDSGYYIKSVLVNKVPVELDDNNQYQLVSISKAQTVIAMFAKNTNDNYYSWQNNFTDVSSDAWYYDSVRFTSSMGLISGIGNNQFGPDIITTREMAVTLLWRIAGEPIVASDCDFSDAEPGAWYYNAIRWGYEFGIIYGYSSDIFGVGDCVTREQLVTFLYRFAKNYAGEDTSLYDNTNILTKYSDALNISAGMTQPFQWAIGAGIIAGTSEKTLSPQGDATRAQVAAILTRYCKNFLLTTPCN